MGTSKGTAGKGLCIIVLIKRYKAGNVVFLQDQVPGLVGALVFWASLFAFGLIAQEEHFSQKFQPR